jgi:hypothetical protein
MSRTLAAAAEHSASLSCAPWKYRWSSWSVGDELKLPSARDELELPSTASPMPAAPLPHTAVRDCREPDVKCISSNVHGAVQTDRHKGTAQEAEACRTC